MSFFRHRQIYQSDAASNRRRNRFRLRLRAHRLDEFAASYSLAGCTPALPASASPAGSILKQSAATVNRTLRTVGDFSTGTMRNFHPVLTFFHLLDLHSLYDRTPTFTVPEWFTTFAASNSGFFPHRSAAKLATIWLLSYCATAPISRSINTRIGSETIKSG
jgi:hypothetical protein